MGPIVEPILDLPDTALPDHTQLPDSDGKPVENFQEHPQSILLTDSIWPHLQQRHPDNQFIVGQNSGIFWWPTSPPLRGCKAPDWFYVPDVPPLLDGRHRRSYVLWQELEAPLIVLEFVSGDGSEERDRTPREGKFWVYERGIRVPYYGIYEVDLGRIELYNIGRARYHLVPPNSRGHFEVEPLGVELGIMHQVYRNMELPWLRWWDLEGNLLLTGEERAEQERQRAEQERQRAEQERQRAEQERQRAEQERQRATAAEVIAQQQQQEIERLRAQLRELENRQE
jgi:Uma2 family endonuclease